MSILYIQKQKKTVNFHVKHIPGLYTRLIYRLTYQ